MPERGVRQLLRAGTGLSLAQYPALVGSQGMARSLEWCLVLAGSLFR